MITLDTDTALINLLLVRVLQTAFWRLLLDIYCMVYISGICYSHALLQLSVQANKSHGSLQHRATGGGITTPVLIQTHLCSKPQLPMICFISLQTSTLQHSGLHRGHYQSISRGKKRDERKHIYLGKCCSVQSCGKLVLLQFLILVCSASLCHCITLVDFDGGKERMRPGLV